MNLCLSKQKIDFFKNLALNHKKHGVLKKKLRIQMSKVLLYMYHIQNLTEICSFLITVT